MQIYILSLSISRSRRMRTRNAHIHTSGTRKSLSTKPFVQKRKRADGSARRQDCRRTTQRICHRGSSRQHGASRDVHFPLSPSRKAHVGSTLGRHGARFPSSCWPRGSRRARWAGPLFLRCMIFPAFASRTPALRAPAGLAVVCLAAHTAAAQPLARAPCLHLSHSCVRTRKVSTHSCERAQSGERSMHRCRRSTL